MTFSSLCPRLSTMARMSTSEGNAMNTSSTRISTESTGPPK